MFGDAGDVEHAVNAPVPAEVEPMPDGFVSAELVTDRCELGSRAGEGYGRGDEHSEREGRGRGVWVAPSKRADRTTKAETPLMSALVWSKP